MVQMRLLGFELRIGLKWDQPAAMTCEYAVGSRSACSRVGQWHPSRRWTRTTDASSTRTSRFSCEPTQHAVHFFRVAPAWSFICYFPAIPSAIFGATLVLVVFAAPDIHDALCLDRWLARTLAALPVWPTMRVSTSA
ncbi:hypothetical protein CONLIGDRAFT_141932 [Coniochaeta ligniaria NRRL 30616]|uniref:Uncharacterized protein n=1 Tax=Coniochaeta ligniaria NRRL 30616 TaxID=1408157 RepID=A0A1J7I761_9PEZI|nr:hypothetical protein CONLIGDRAFT_141932 [Coniochaeta ligniaria NRRL 30616]